MELAEGLSIPGISVSDPVVFFPVRHHSPACAFHISKLIEKIRPVAVLIEGPSNANHLIGLLASEEAQMPLAIYASCVQPGKASLPDRFAAYYPFCDYSPELVAIREGKKIGATVEFMDLDYPTMVASESDPEIDKSRNLFAESHLRHSQMLRAACERSGARDHDDLWDSLFETAAVGKETDLFIREVLTYCALSRADATDAELKADGTHHREAAMASAIVDWKKKIKKGEQILVVTGGYHTVALPDLISGKTKQRLKKLMPRGKGETLLIRYNFPQLDRLNGYSSGMPSPEFYQRSWESPGTRDSSGENLSRWIVALARELRKKKFPVSPADEIACLAQVRRLAEMRRHPTPSREDLLDGIRSVFIKGEHDIEGVHIMAEARKMLCGTRIGKVPQGAEVPPLVLDFQSIASELKLTLDSVERKEIVLDLYRKTKHRQASRFMYRLQFLEVTFSQRVRGPDFVAGRNLDRIQEAWKYLWEPATESCLIEASIYGATLEEASLNCLLEKFEKAGAAADATALLVEGCRMGLHDEIARLVPKIGKILQKDPGLDSLVAALGHLITLVTSSEPLEAHQLPGVSDLALQAFELACYRLPDLGSVSDEKAEKLVVSLKDLSMAISPLNLSVPEESILWNGLLALDEESTAPAIFHGAISGILYSNGRRTESELAARLKGYLQSASTDRAQGARFIEGLLDAARDVLWNVTEIVDCLDQFLREIKEEEFMSVVPHLRLAFSGLTAREIDTLAHRVKEKTDLSMEEAAKIWHSQYTSADRDRASSIDSAVLDLLEKDHLEDLLEDIPTTT